MDLLESRKLTRCNSECSWTRYEIPIGPILYAQLRKESVSEAKDDKISLKQPTIVNS